MNIVSRDAASNVAICGKQLFAHCVLNGILYSMYKVNTSFHWSEFGGALLLMTTLICRAGDQIQVYSVPERKIPRRNLLRASQPGAHLIFLLILRRCTGLFRRGGRAKPADGIRLASFAINRAKASVAITSFPGSVGTELD